MADHTVNLTGRQRDVLEGMMRAHLQDYADDAKDGFFWIDYPDEELDGDQRDERDNARLYREQARLYRKIFKDLPIEAQWIEGGTKGG